MTQTNPEPVAAILIPSHFDARKYYQQNKAQLASDSRRRRRQSQIAF